LKVLPPYVATDEPETGGQRATLLLSAPLLDKGEPGTGQDMARRATGRVHGDKLITWHIKSDTKAHQGLYEYDAVSRLRDSALGN